MQHLPQPGEPPRATSSVRLFHTRAAGPRGSPRHTDRARAVRARRSALAAGATASAETKNVTASSAIANGAVSAWIRQPAMPGPISADDVSPSVILALASTSRVRPGHLREQDLIRRAADDVLHCRRKADRVTESRSTARRDHAATGIASNASPRPMSAAITTGSLRTRSSSTPACRRHQRERQRLERDQHAHLERRRLQQQRRGQRQREVGDLRAERRDRQRRSRACGSPPSARGLGSSYETVAADDT